MNHPLGSRQNSEKRRLTRGAPLRLSQRGFSLVELLIAMAIIAVLATFMTPSVMNYVRRNQGQAAANKVAGIFGWARAQAMNRGQVVFLQVSPGGTNSNGSVAAFRSNDGRTTCGGTRVAVNERGLNLGDTSPNMEILGTNTNGAVNNLGSAVVFCFTPDGRILNELGQPFSSNCDGVNARIFVQDSSADRNVVNPLGNQTLDACQTNPTDAQRQEQKNGRMLRNFYVVQVPFNGAVTVVQ